MTANKLIGIGLLCAIGSPQLFGQDSAKPPETRSNRPATPAPSATMPPGVTVNPAQPYRPLPANTNALRPRPTIFEFYLGALNPRKIQWGDEIDRRLAILAEHSVANPYFRVCAFQTGVILILVLLSWVWWDKMRQIKHVAAECLADVINAKLLADRRALDAIGTYNRHIEMCNRVIEQQESGLTTGRNDAGLQQALADLQAQLATERSQKGRLEAELKQREELHSKLEERLTQLETAARDRRSDPNADLVARLERAEAELNNRRRARK